MIVALLVSSGASWESRALEALNQHPGVVVLKRCVDVDDLLATASTGQASVAVVAAELVGLDHAAVEELRQYGVRLVGVAADPDVTRPKAARIGIETVLAADRIGEIGDVVTTAPAAPTVPAGESGSAAPGVPPPPAAGRVIAVWGPSGAPGRTTVAAGVAAELARRGLPTLLVDADPYGGAVAQQLGVLDEVSGLLAATRLVASGTLEERFGTVQRRLSDRLHLITGLPRADRWQEVRGGTLEQLVDCARRDTQVVLDTGFSLEQGSGPDIGARAERNGLTLEAVSLADEVVVVGSADPVGLARLARGVSELHELLPGATVRVVVNRMRPTLGWREADVAGMLAGIVGHRPVHFLPEDRAAVDRALVAGRTLVEAGESALTRAVAGLLDAMAGMGSADGVPARGRARRRRRH